MPVPDSLKLEEIRELEERTDVFNGLSNPWNILYRLVRFIVTAVLSLLTLAGGKVSGAKPMLEMQRNPFDSTGLSKPLWL